VALNPVERVRRAGEGVDDDRSVDVGSGVRELGNVAADQVAKPVSRALKAST
jgi:hypothetical protein